MTLHRLAPRTRMDLHVHTARSDGRYAPRDVLTRCAAAGLDLVAITDHDLASDLAPGAHQTDAGPVHVLVGAEVSGVHEGREHHLLVYFPGEVPAGFQAFCREQTLERSSRYDAALRSLDLPELPAADAAALRGERALTRHHIARALVAAGHATDVRDAFDRYLGERHGHVPSLSLSFVDAIRIARSYGGVTSWAHPPPAQVERHLATFAAAGLQGLEGLRPGLPSKLRNVYKKAAKRHGLFLTGGSDWHGWAHDGDLGLFHVLPGDLRGFLDALGATGP